MSTTHLRVWTEGGGGYGVGMNLTCIQAIKLKREEILKQREWVYVAHHSEWRNYNASVYLTACCRIFGATFELTVASPMPSLHSVTLCGDSETDFVHMLNKIPDIIVKLEELRELTADCYADE